MKNSEKSLQFENNGFRVLEGRRFRNKFFKVLNYINRPQFISVSNLAKDILNSCPPDSTVIDLGAGDCKWRRLFSDCKYIGIDSAVGDRSCNYGKCDYIADITKETPLSGNSADVIICMAVLGHVFEPSKVFVEANRLLKPGGYFFAISEFAKARHQIPYDSMRLTEESIRKHSIDSGFEVVYIKGSNSFYSSILNLMESYAWKVRSIHSLFLKIIIKLGMFNLLYWFDSDTANTSNLFPIYFLIKCKKPG